MVPPLYGRINPRWQHGRWCFNLWTNGFFTSVTYLSYLPPWPLSLLSTLHTFVQFQVTKHTTQFVTTVVDYTVQTAGTRGMWWLKSLVPTQQIYMLLVFSVYSVISLEILTFFLPLASFYAAFFAMVVCTMQMFYRFVLYDVIRHCSWMSGFLFVRPPFLSHLHLPSTFSLFHLFTPSYP